MTPTEAQRTRDLEQRLSEAQAAIEALLSGQIDAVLDSSSRTPVLLAKAQDELRRSAVELRHERDRAQRYLDTAEVIILKLDLKGSIVLVNRYACSLLGRTNTELEGQDWIDTCLPERIRKKSRDNLHLALAGKLSTFENPILTASGEERLIEWRNTVARDRDGFITGTFSSGTDITERTKAVEALRSTEERTRFALDSANIGVWEWDVASGMVRWSEVLEAQYGILPGTFEGTFEAYIACIHADDRELVRKSIATALATKSDFTHLSRAVRPDGTIRWLSGAGRILMNEDGKPIRGVGISQDVTERRELERQYLQAQKMEAVGQLASGVAHDFNNLLTVILGCAELMMSDGEVAEIHAPELKEMIKAARSAADLTRQLLAFGRQQVLHTAPVDVNALITEMTGMLGRLIGESIEVELALAPELPLSLVDRGQLEQVMMNLVVNARDALSGGGQIIIATAEAQLDSSSLQEVKAIPGSYVMISVSDTGSGMTQETQRRLFEPFYTTKELGKGTGLGLSTTYGMIRQSKGYIVVESELGRGTTFRMYLPMADRAAAAQSSGNPSRVASQDPLVPHSALPSGVPFPGLATRPLARPLAMSKQRFP